MPPAPLPYEEALACRVNLLNALRKELYYLPGCVCGGPLHIAIDDSNLRDGDLVFCEEELRKPGWEHVYGVGIAILHELRWLSEGQRLLWWRYASFEDVLKARGKGVVTLPDGYAVEP